MSAKESIVQYAEKRKKKLVNIKCEFYIKQKRLSTDILCIINKKCGNCEQNEGREKQGKIVVDRKSKYMSGRKKVCLHAEKNAYSIDETHIFCYHIVCLD